MATIWKRDEYQYCARVRRKGINKTKTFETYEEARVWSTRLEAKIDGNEFNDLTLAQETTLRDALEWYKESVIPRTPKSARHKKTLVKYWLSHEFADFSLLGLSTKDIAEWRKNVLDETVDDPEDREPECSAQTVVHRMNLLSHLYNTIELEWEIDGLRNPIVRKLRPLLDNARTRRLIKGSNEEKRLFEACDNNTDHPWLGTCVRLALHTAMRRGEIYNIEWSDIDLKTEYPSIFLPVTKTSYPRTIPLWAGAVKLLKDYADTCETGTSKLFPTNNTTMITRQFEEAVKAAKIKDLRFHDLRHEATSRLFEETDLRDLEIMAITGHRSPSMLKRYTHLQTKTLSKYERRAF